MKKNDVNSAESFLREIGCDFRLQADGTIFVPGSISLAGRKLTALPDLSDVVVAGNFSCANNLLSSLKGAPECVGGYFDCSDNRLTTLKGSPRAVGGDFRCSINLLTSLEDGPNTVGGNYDCIRNKLTTLQGVASSVGGRLWCSVNRLATLDFLPDFYEAVKADVSEAFNSARKSKPVAGSRNKPQRVEQLQLDTAVQEATVLKNGIKINKPLKIKK